jgi:hypothetical protein
MKRHSLSILAVVATLGFAWVVTSPTAFGRSPSTTINSKVGNSVIRGLGSKAPFAVASCTSAAPTSVACAVWNAAPPQDSVRVWCLTPTALSGVSVTVAYVAEAPRSAVPPTTLTVHCKAASVPNVPTPGWKTGTPLNANAPPFTVTGCSVNVLGTDCTFAGETITKVCALTATLNTLPVMVTATVTLAGSPAIAGKTVHVYYVCK